MQPLFRIRLWSNREADVLHVALGGDHFFGLVRHDDGKLETVSLYNCDIVEPAPPQMSAPDVAPQVNAELRELRHAADYAENLIGARSPEGFSAADRIRSAAGAARRNIDALTAARDEACDIAERNVFAPEINPANAAHVGPPESMTIVASTNWSAPYNDKARVAELRKVGAK